MATTYQVQQGDYVSKVASQFDVTDYHLIWDHPSNQVVKSKRQNPNVLFPGDRLYIPDKGQKAEDRATSKTHVFTINQRTIRLRIILRGPDQEPIRFTECTLEVGNQTFDLTTDPFGAIDQMISTDATEASVLIHDLTIPVKIGYLDPVDTPTGQVARLRNLGYYRGPQDQDTVDATLLQSAIEEFQLDYLGFDSVNGTCGSATQDKLKEIHGC